MKQMDEILKKNKKHSNLDKQILDAVYEAKTECSSRLEYLKCQLNKFRRLYHADSGYTDFHVCNKETSAEELGILNHFFQANCQLIKGLEKVKSTISKDFSNKIEFKLLERDLRNFSAKNNLIQESIKLITAAKVNNNKDNGCIQSAAFNAKDIGKFSGHVAIVLDSLEDVNQPQLDQQKQTKGKNILGFLKSSSKKITIKFCVHNMPKGKIHYNFNNKQSNSNNLKTQFSFNNTDFLEINFFKSDVLFAFTYVKIEDAILFSEYASKIKVHIEGQLIATFSFKDVISHKNIYVDEILTRKKVFNRMRSN